MARAVTASRPKKLAEYAAKRNFANTPEPGGDEAPKQARDQARSKSATLSFAVQKHAATRLHYDFRLEWQGVLKSWAVPKGPSYNPADKRLAVEVEDHPLAYGGFEGEIPPGQYGSGTVVLWDRGYWEPIGDAAAGFKSGRLKFVLHGEKLLGKWTLIRLGADKTSRGKTSWLLRKERDGFARNADAKPVVDEAPGSVLRRPKRKSTPSASIRIDGKASKEALPRFVEPQLAAAATTSPEGENWIHELKLDGYRVQARIEARPRPHVQLLTRSSLDWTHRIPAIAKALEAIPAQSAILDGEVVVFAADGTTSFADLQASFAQQSAQQMHYVVFDILHLNGRAVRGLPLMKRKSILSALFANCAEDGIVRLAGHLQGSGHEIYSKACELGAEGVISKKADGVYRSGRGADWLKRKCHLEQEFVIGGFTLPTHGEAGIGALVLGYYRSGKLIYAGRTGTGFTQKSHRSVRAQLEKLRSQKSPFDQMPRGTERGVIWVKPSAVAQVRFAAWTADHLVRQAAFKGLREDKPASSVTRETEALPSDSQPNAAPSLKRAAAKPAPAGISMRLTHPDRVLDAESEMTKQDLAAYYQAVATALWPHIDDRPLTLVRCQQGSGRTCFYQRHFGASLPRGVEAVPIAERKTGKVEQYLKLSSAASLVELAQFSVLEIHAWGSLGAAPEKPDRITIDLDPGPGVAWSDLAAAAIEARKRLEDAGLAAFLKSTGGKGLHVVAPIIAEHTWPGIKDFAHKLVLAMEAKNKSLYLTKMTKAARQGKIYLDYLRNDHGATAIAPYSPRARAGAPVAVPLAWSELKAGTAPRFTVPEFSEWSARLKQDPWKSMPGKARRLKL